MPYTYVPHTFKYIIIGSEKAKLAPLENHVDYEVFITMDDWKTLDVTSFRERK